MKTQKMSFKNIKDVLSRDEMKKIMAGSNCYYSCRCGNGVSFGCPCNDCGASSSVYCNGTGATCYPA